MRLILYTETNFIERKNFMANYLMIRHKVQDFAVWKPGFDAHAPSRKENGLTLKQLLRGADDPNEVILLFEAADLNRAKAFAGSPDLKDIMQKAGVIGAPDIHFLAD
jgi:hypothetical protein